MKKVGENHAKIHVTGHSLGGWVAIELAKKYPNEISGGHVFNAGSSPLRVFMDYFVQKAWATFTNDKVSHGEFHHHHMNGDLLSRDFIKIGHSHTTRYKSENKVGLETHKISNFAKGDDPKLPLYWFSKSTRFDQI